jgi:aminoglycoside phosphotransferase (APT) family kinase protein
MSKPVVCEPLPERPLEHPAVAAWSRLGPKRIEPEAIERLKLKNKSAVYRLRGVGPDGSAVIAKRCQTPTARIERVIYEECLACLPVPSPRFYGLLEDSANRDFCWLFLEDASGQEYALDDAEHRRSAGRWLGTIHTCAAEPAGLLLPDRGPGHYLKLLRCSHAAVVKQLVNPALSAEEIATLHDIAVQLNFVESHWAEVEEFCGTIPNTLVHGDLVAKNVRLKVTQSGLALFVFDWENGGWGVPATDLCQFADRTTLSPDLQTYAASLAERGWQLEPGRLRQLAEYGNIFRVLDDIAWAASIMVSDSYRFLVKPISQITVYERLMADALRPMKWNN